MFFITSADNITRKIIAKLRKLIAAHPVNGYIKRAAHPKGLGLVKGTFSVYPDMPESLRIGLFKKKAVYPTLIRFSNSNPLLQTDSLKDIRGCSIKLILDNENSQAQDFILASCPKIVWGTWKEFSSVLYMGLNNPFRLALSTICHNKLYKFIAMYKMMRHDTSPLDICYWSITPYSLGKLAVKYKLIPTSSYKSSLPDKLSKDYLTANMQNHLAAHPASFDFFVQLAVDDEHTPIDDMSKIWPEKLTPLIKVGTINIPPQNFNTIQRTRLMENITYSPGNSLEEHHALGKVNKERITIYRSLSAFRHSKNNVPPVIITKQDYDEIT